MTALRIACCLVLAAGTGAAQTDPIRSPIAERRSDAYGGATAAYLALVSEVGRGELTPAAERHLVQLALILPGPLERRVRDRLASRSDPALGQSLAVWWRRQDPLPTTASNERVLEHLLRVVAAEEAFAADTPTGFDARGDTFVRFGAPKERRVIDFEGNLFIARAIRQEPSVRRSDFPRNEAWHYPDLGPDIYFVFVQRRGGYVSAEPLDLLPRALLAGGLSEATAGRARLLGQALRWIYKDLYTYSSGVRNRLLTLDGAVGGDGDAFSGNTALVLQSELRRARFEDADARAARDAALPASATSVRNRPFGVSSQAAVFMDSEGGDETYAVWAGWEPDADVLTATEDSLAGLGLSPERFAIAATAVVYSPAYERVDASPPQVLMISDVRNEPQWTVAEGLPPGGHVALEWDLYPATDTGRALPPGTVAADVLRVDSVGVGWAGDVGLSGLLAVEAASLLATPEIDRLGAFPVARPAVGTASQVAVYYEVYGRRLGAEVEVEVRAVRVRDGRILRPGSALRTSSTSVLLVDEPRIPQVAVVDLEDLEGADELRLDVVVTDTVTLATTTQSLTFDLD